MRNSNLIFKKTKRVAAAILAAALVLGGIPYSMHARADEEIVEETVEVGVDVPSETEASVDGDGIASSEVSTEVAPEETATEETAEDNSGELMEAVVEEPAVVEEAVVEESEQSVEQAENKEDTVVEQIAIALEYLIEKHSETNEQTDSVEPQVEEVASQPVEQVDLIEQQQSLMVEQAAEQVADNKGEGEGAGGAGGSSSRVLTPENFQLLSSPEGSIYDGTHNEFTFSFDFAEEKVEEVTKPYRAYVYGRGVNQAICEQLMQAYAKVLATGKDNKVINSGNAGFVDANKSTDSQSVDYNRGYDSRLCFAYSAGNALYQTKWINKTNAGIFNVDGSAAAYFKTEDDIADYSAYCFIDHGGDEQDYWKWMFTGLYAGSGSVGRLRYGDDPDDALLSEYYDNDIYVQDDLDLKGKEKDFLGEVLNAMLANPKLPAANTVGIYFLSANGGGHAMSLTGYIAGPDGYPAALIVADPDDMVGDPNQPKEPEKKDKAYNVFPIQWNETGKRWELLPNPEGYNAYVGDISTIVDSVGRNPDSSKSIIPTATRAISDNYSNDGDYSFDYTHTFEIPLNLDFLSFYDITTLKYRLLNELNEELYSGKIENTKSEWKELIKNNAVSVSVGFGDTLENAADGKYKIQVEIDKDCFSGNYGWFAKKYNNGQGYFDRLVDTWVKLVNGMGGDAPQDVPASTPVVDDYIFSEDISEVISVESNSDKSAQEEQYIAAIENSMEEAVQESIVEAFLNEIVAQLNVAYENLVLGLYDDVDVAVDGVNVADGTVVLPISAQAVQENVKVVVSNLLMAKAQDENTLNMFKAYGIDLKKADVSKMNVVLSSSVKMTKAGKVVFSVKNRKFKSGDLALAMIELNNGSVAYVKANVLPNGRLEFALPANVKEITVIAL